MQYSVESFTEDEARVLRRHFTNLNLPVFALVNLPEVVKGALFARYSRYNGSLRRLFLDEFAGDLEAKGAEPVDATVGLARAEKLYERVFSEFGDDSVAQLGGVHLACEQASNLLTKILEWGRLMSYLEQSTRYMPYDKRDQLDRYRYYRDPAVMESSIGRRYERDMDRIFDIYSQLLPVMVEYFEQHHPKQSGDTDSVWRSAVRAKAFDSLRGLLPAGALSNLGIYGTGQGYEQLLLRMQAHPLPEARAYAKMMLTELRKVIPSFLTRVDREDRGVAWSAYLEQSREEVATLVQSLVQEDEAYPADEVTLVDWDPEAEDKLVAAIMWPHTELSERQVMARVKSMTAQERQQVLRAFVGERTNRRHKPGRPLERTAYRFEVLSDYGAFRDLQRHRMLTIEWQRLTPYHSWDRPISIAEAGVSDLYTVAMLISFDLHEALVRGGFAEQAAYAVAFGYKIRYTITMNAREAMHILELRTAPQGHPSYRRVCQQMHRLIKEQAGHHGIAGMMRFVDHESTDGLERLEGERRAQKRRQAHDKTDPS